MLTWPWQREARAGDVVVFDGRGSLSPESPESPQRTAEWLVGVTQGDQYVKRVTGLPGERVACDGSGGPLLVNGQTAGFAGAENCGRQRFDVRLPAGRLWLMGDNRENSRDSRSLLGAPGGGGVRETRVVGRVIWVWHS